MGCFLFSLFFLFSKVMFHVGVENNIKLYLMYCCCCLYFFSGGVVYFF